MGSQIFVGNLIFYYLSDFLLTLKLKFCIRTLFRIFFHFVLYFITLLSPLFCQSTILETSFIYLYLKYLHSYFFFSTTSKSNRFLGPTSHALKRLFYRNNSSIVKLTFLNTIYLKPELFNLYFIYLCYILHNYVFTFKTVK